MRSLNMSLVKVKGNYQITIPHELREKIHLAVGDYVEVESRKGGLFIKPVRVVPKDDAWFYTKEWQKGEAQADKDIEKGDVTKPVSNIKGAKKVLKKAKV